MLTFGFDERLGILKLRRNKRKSLTVYLVDDGSQNSCDECCLYNTCGDLKQKGSGDLCYKLGLTLAPIHFENAKDKECRSGRDGVSEK